MMEAYTYSNARQNLSEVLDLALKEGQAKIMRRDGTSFIIRPEKRRKSPLDIKGVNVKGLEMPDILDAIKESRKRY
jgi:hypothetical protein